MSNYKNFMMDKLLPVALVFGLASLLLSFSAQAEESLYTRLGGTYNIASTVDHLVDKIYVNKGLNANPNLKAIHDNPGSKAGFKVMLTNWVVQETGGPKIYQPDEFGRGKSMKNSHPHLNISDREFDIIMTECLHTFYAFNVPQKEVNELMAGLQKYRKDIVTAK